MADDPQSGASTTTAPDGEITAQERFDWLKRRIVVWVLALALLALAVIGALFAFGEFTASSSNAANVFSAGILEIHNDKQGSAILTADHMVPGQSKDGEVTIQNTGNVAGHFTLHMENLANPTTGTGDELLSDHLHLKIQEGTNAPIYDGKLGMMNGGTNPISLGEWAAEEQHTYKFTVTFQSTGTSAGDNALQGTQTQADFVWGATAGT